MLINQNSKDFGEKKVSLPIKTSSLPSLLISTALSVVAWSAPAVAQTAPTQVESQGGKLQEIVVTAERKKQNLQKTAATVLVVSGAKIQQQGQNNLQEILQNTPSVTVSLEPNGQNVDIRGQGADLPSFVGQSSVGLLDDGVYQLAYEAAQVGYYDLARVEVLPGPQATNYGTSSDAGIVNVISNDPVLGKYSVAASFNLGNYNLYRGEVAVNLPIGDDIAIRVAGAAVNRTSFYTPHAGDQVAQSGRVKLLYKPNDKLSVEVKYELSHVGGLGEGGSVTNYQNGDINKESNPWTLNAISAPGTLNSTDSQDHIYQSTVAANISYRLGDFAVLQFLPSYLTINGQSRMCGPGGRPGSIGTPGVCNTAYVYSPFYQWTAEERLTNAPGSLIEWDAGVYHWNYNLDNWFNRQQPDSTIEKRVSNAGYGELTYPVFNNFRLIAGARETYDDRTYNDGIHNAPLAKISSHHFDYRVGAQYDLTPTSHLYATVSTGERDGGFEQASTPSNQETFKPEEITSFEFGSKNRFLDNTLQVNGDIFYYNQKNYQVYDFYVPSILVNGSYCTGAPSEPSPCQPPTVNVKAHELGLEFQTQWLATPADQFNVSGTFLFAEFDKQSGPCATAGAPTGGCYFAYNDPITNVVDYGNVANETQPHAPHAAGSFSYTHTFSLASGAAVLGGVNLYAVSGQYVFPIENSYSYQPAYWSQALNLAYTSANQLWSLNAYVRNLSNYAVKEIANPFTAIGEPRTFGLVASVHW